MKLTKTQVAALAYANERLVAAQQEWEEIMRECGLDPSRTWQVRDGVAVLVEPPVALPVRAAEAS